MFGIGIQELLIIFVVALLVLGPTKLPGVARSLGKGLKELRKASDDLRTAFLLDDDEPSRKHAQPPTRAAANAPVTATVPADGAGGIHGSLAAGTAAVALTHDSHADPDDDALGAAQDGIVSRGEQGGDPHKRALDPPARAPEDEHEGPVPSDPDVSAMLDDARRESARVAAEPAPQRPAPAPAEKDATS